MPRCVGFTYDLKDDYALLGLEPERLAEFDSLQTIDAIDGALRALGYEVDRIGHVKNLNARLAAGERWDFVFNIAEGLYGTARESQIPTLLDAYEIPYVFSDGATLALALDKGLSKLVFQAHNIPTAPFVIVRTLEDLDSVTLPYPLFAKPIAEGTGKGISEQSRILDKESLSGICSKLLTSYNQPVLLERYLPGREFTVGMLGSAERTRVLGIMEIFIDRGNGRADYTYDNKIDWFEGLNLTLLKNEPDLESAITGIAIRAWRALGCRDGGRLDVRCDETGAPMLLEINPLAGLSPGFSDLCVLAEKAGVGYESLIGTIIEEFLARQPHQEKERTHAAK